MGIFSACLNHSEIFYVHFVCHKTIIYKIRASSCSCWSQWVFLQLLFNSSRIDDWNWAAAERLVLKQNCGQKSKVTLSSWRAESITFIFPQWHPDRICSVYKSNIFYWLPELQSQPESGKSEVLLLLQSAEDSAFRAWLTCHRFMAEPSLPSFACPSSGGWKLLQEKCIC